MNEVLLEKNSNLTKDEKKMFAYFGENAKIRPPFRILNPHRIKIGDRTSIREGAYIHAYQDLTKNLSYIEPKYKNEFCKEDYIYDSEIIIGQEVLISRSMLLTCTAKVVIDDNVAIGQCTLIGDNNHMYSHPYVPIMQQPNEFGKPIFIGKGTWIGVNGAILSGTTLGKNCVVGANSVVSGKFPNHAVISMEKAKMIFQRYDIDN